MKTKLLMGITICFVLSSCVNDFIGNGPKEINLSSENYLAYDNLFDVFGPIEINNIEKQLSTTQDDKEIVELKQRLNYLENELDLIIDVSKFYGLPVPCVSLPNGKCVPVRLEFFLIPGRFTDATVMVQNIKGDVIGVANELSPLPEFNGELNLLRIPVIKSESELTITFITKDKEGIENSISGTIIGE